MGSAPEFRKLLRFEIGPVSCASYVVDALCCHLAESEFEFSQRGYITWFHGDTNYIQNLRFTAFEASLYQALTDALNGRDVFDISQLSLSLYVRGTDEKKLMITTSTQDVVQYTTSGTQITTFSESILNVDEDTVDAIVSEIIKYAGPSFYGILLDAFGSLVSSRRLDVAKLILFSLKKLSDKSNDSNMRNWMTETLMKYNEVFEFYNDGVRLKYDS